MQRLGRLHLLALLDVSALPQAGTLHPCLELEPFLDRGVRIGFLTAFKRNAGDLSLLCVRGEFHSDGVKNIQLGEK